MDFEGPNLWPVVAGDELLEAQAHIWNHIFSFVNSMSLKCAIQLGIPDAIHRHGPNPMPLSLLVSSLQLHPNKTQFTAYRIQFWEYMENNSKDGEVFNAGMASDARLVMSVILGKHKAEEPNFKYVEGDMFQAIPPVDAIILKWILHNWSDEECAKILKKWKEAITSNGNKRKVMIIDMVVNLE
ncbi:unnamed protein product [Citrullus colocynthis]|uniref:Uncharacterized protein n=1 Tax=Citrullus colocynthis TaxID=252529 RepID=A0ABP0Y704_9ROSI